MRKEKKDIHRTYVRFYKYFRLIKGESAYRPCRIGPDARKRVQFVRRVGKGAALCNAFAYKTAGLLQKPRAAVIAQPAPQSKHFRQRSQSKTLYVRETLEPRFVFGKDALGLRLLQHNFGHENLVGIDRMPPRKIAGRSGIKIQNASPKLPYSRIVDFYAAGFASVGVKIFFHIFKHLTKR